MASHLFNYAKQQVLLGNIDLGADDIRVALLMTNTTADTENDGIQHIDDITTLDEHDGANYARQALDNEAVNLDDANDRAEFDADDPTWTALGAGTRSAAGMLVYKHVNDDTDSIPIAWVEFASPVVGDGTNFTVEFSAEGLLQLS